MNYNTPKMLHYRLKTKHKSDDYPKSNSLLTLICAMSSLITLFAVIVTLAKK